MKTLTRRILLAQEEAGIGDQLGTPLFLKVVDQSIPDPDSPTKPALREWKVVGYKASAWFPVYRSEGDDPFTVDAHPGESDESLQRRCEAQFPRVALWMPIHSDLL